MAEQGGAKETKPKAEPSSSKLAQGKGGKADKE